LQDLAIFETSPYFDRREKALLRYAEGMTRTLLTFPTQRLKKYAPCSAPNKSSTDGSSIVGKLSRAIQLRA
jgi:hypothetical protein